MNALDIKELFELPDAELFSAAHAVACNHAGFMQASPIILTGNCTTRPICNHCKWEYFKEIKSNWFVLDKATQECIEKAQKLHSRGIPRAFCATGWMGYQLPTRFIDQVAQIHETVPELELYGLFGALCTSAGRLNGDAYRP